MDDIPIKKAVPWLPFAIFLLGAAVRIALFGAHPGGINQDEAFAGYEAWCLLNYGRDSAGYAFPVYLTAWGSGMNALESYMMMPFIAIFGLKTWVIRLPQLIMALLSLPVSYLTVRKLRDERTALIAMALLAICPWHIMLSRWGLESNLTPAFFLLGFYFFLKASEDSRFLLLSALMYGLSLYCYATIWPILPFLILAQTLFCLKKGLLKADRYMLLSALLLLIMALPLLYFLAVNFGLAEELRTPFFSIPKLLYMRSEEFGIREITENARLFFGLLLRQQDGLAWNFCGSWGLIYFISAPFCIAGLAESIYRCKKKSAPLEALMLMQLAAGLILGFAVKANVNRVNIIFIPLVIFAAFGIAFFCSISGRKMRAFILALYALFFIGFSAEYFGSYRYIIGYYFDAGLEQALEAAKEKGADKIYLPEDMLYPKVLFYSRTPPDEFEESVEYELYPSPFLKARSFANFVFGSDGEENESSVYIVKTRALPEGFACERYENFVVAYEP